MWATYRVVVLWPRAPPPDLPDDSSFAPHELGTRVASHPGLPASILTESLRPPSLRRAPFAGRSVDRRSPAADAGWTGAQVATPTDTRVPERPSPVRDWLLQGQAHRSRRFPGPHA